MSTKAQSEKPPLEWVYLRNPHSDRDNNASAFCSFVEKFFWRSRDGKPNELHVVILGEGSENRYRYFDVPREVYNEMWRRAHNPADYDRSFGSWFSQKIRDMYEFDKYTG